MASIALPRYQARDFSSLRGLSGISDEQIEVHLALYQGYVTNANKLNEEVAELSAQGKGGDPVVAELRRRFGFEYNGMVLHELYFGNLTPNGAALPPPTSALVIAATKSFGSWEDWLADYKRITTMRGIGWAVAFQDPTNGAISNHWITLHEQGIVAGFKPLLVMDLWEHAFMVDYRPAQKAKYFEAFFSNVNWEVVSQRAS